MVLPLAQSLLDAILISNSFLEDDRIAPGDFKSISFNENIPIFWIILLITKKH